MTPNPVTLPANSTLNQAAAAMRDANIGDVFVTRDGQMCGIVTDRDIVVRGLANGSDAEAMSLSDVCSADLTSVSSTDSVKHGLDLMREHAIRRLPVIDDGMPVGVVSLGDLAEERSATPTFRDISGAPANT